MNKAKKIIIKAFKRKKKERGLKIILPDIELAEAHIKKARHNTIVMDDLDKLDHTDWVVIVAYYNNVSRSNSCSDQNRIGEQRPRHYCSNS